MKKRIGGPFVAVGLLGVAALMAVGTCSRFSADHPVGQQVSLLDEQRVEAVFDAGAGVREGLRATLTYGGKRDRYYGRVTAVEPEDDGVRVVVRLAEVPPDPEGKPMFLTVDLSIPPEALKPN